jgi:hypothetical protein
MNNDCEFDIERVYVISVERSKKDKFEGVFFKKKISTEERTIIGYLDKDFVVKEWYLDCSPEKHQDFVRRFRKKLKLAT